MAHPHPPLSHHPWSVAGRMAARGLTLVPLALGTLAAGMVIYHVVESLDWSDAFLNAAMLLGGMGPIAPIKTTLGKWLVGMYALFAGLVFIVLAGIMLGPVIHTVLHHFDLEARSAKGD